MEYLGVPFATLAGWMFGAFWYTGFSKPWLAAIEMNKDEIGAKKRPLNPMIASVLAEFLLALVLFYVLKRMSVVGFHWGAMVGLIIGVGIILPTVFVNNIFPGRKTMLTLIDGGHWIGVTTIMGTVMGFVASLDLASMVP